MVNIPVQSSSLCFYHKSIKSNMVAALHLCSSSNSQILQSFSDSISKENTQKSLVTTRLHFNHNEFVWDGNLDELKQFIRDDLRLKQNFKRKMVVAWLQSEIVHKSYLRVQMVWSYQEENCHCNRQQRVVCSQLNA